MKETIIRPLKILTWHVHGSYLYYLTQAPCQFFLPVKPERPEGYAGCPKTLAWGKNVHEIPANKVKDAEFDCILFQSRKNYLEDQYEILSPAQRELPKIYLEHDPPREVPTDTSHLIDDPDMLLVHVTHFNKLMWDNNRTPTMVIEHGVTIPDDASYSGTIYKGIVVINHLKKRGRRLGLDVFEAVREQIPLDLIGMGSEELGGLGEVPLPELPAFISRYRFFFNPIRYTSLGLSVCEAMLCGMPIVGLATTEMAVTIENGQSGFMDTNVDGLIKKMQLLLDDPGLAKRLGNGARHTALEKFSITRFTDDWLFAFQYAVSREKTAIYTDQL